MSENAFIPAPTPIVQESPVVVQNSIVEQVFDAPAPQVIITEQHPAEVYGPRELHLKRLSWIFLEKFLNSIQLL